MNRLLLVGAGGFAGAVLRYLLGGAVQVLSRTVAFPWGTFAVNVAGCFAIGAITYYAEERGVLGTEARLLLVTGFLGGFTTFSAYGHETFLLLRDGAVGAAAANALGQVAIGIGAIWAGRAVVQAVVR